MAERRTRYFRSADGRARIALASRIIFGDRTCFHPGWVFLMRQRLVAFVEVDATTSAVIEALLPALGAGAGSGCFSDFTTQVEADSEGGEGGDDEDSGHKAIGPLAIRSRGGGP